MPADPDPEDTARIDPEELRQDGADAAAYEVTEQTVEQPTLAEALRAPRMPRRPPPAGPV